MPIYEYQCGACGGVFEEWRRHADDSTEQPCPKCARMAYRVISNTSFVLKGGGWYVTEYGNRKSEANAGGVNTESPAPDSGAPDAPAGASTVEPSPPPVPAAAPAS